MNDTRTVAGTITIIHLVAHPNPATERTATPDQEMGIGNTMSTILEGIDQ
jgi:hypothetical protein